jgi:hypothetical protein
VRRTANSSFRTERTGTGRPPSSVSTASQAERDLADRERVGRQDDCRARRVVGRPRTRRSRSRRTNPLRARSSGSPGVQTRRRDAGRAGWASCHNSRCVHRPRTAADGATIPALRRPDIQRTAVWRPPGPVADRDPLGLSSLNVTFGRAMIEARRCLSPRRAQPTTDAERRQNLATNNLRSSRPPRPTLLDRRRASSSSSTIEAAQAATKRSWLTFGQGEGDVADQIVVGDRVGVRQVDLSTREPVARSPPIAMKQSPNDRFTTRISNWSFRGSSPWARRN